ncbi:hypothetical protein B0H12DRAFT_1072111 [Mycena haematopus]|nr:hypothetical protein B0H12DRAFT_1072111 [Mycena haematopus]
MSATRLLNTALVSRKLYDLVRHYLEWLRIHGTDEDTMSVDTEWTPDASTDEDTVPLLTMSDELRNDFTLNDIDINSDSVSDDDAYMPSFDDDNAVAHLTERVPVGDPAIKNMDLLGMAASHVLRPKGFPNMPCELTMQVMCLLPLVDRCSLAQTCHTAAAVAAECLMSAAVAILAPFGLRFEEVRLMLAATGAVIAGSSVAALLNLDTTLRPTRLSFVVPRGSVDLVLEFLDYAADYSLHSYAVRYHMSNAHAVWTLTNACGNQIQVFESKTQDPFSTIATSPFTCEYGAWTANGLFHAYPKLTADHRALTTPTRLPVRHTLDDQQMLWDSVHQYTDSNYVVDTLGYSTGHRCGGHPSCPATLRTTDDRGCIYMRFPAWDLDTDFVDSNVISWSLGGTGCLSGLLARAGARVLSATGSADGKWAADIMAVAALTFRLAPAESVQI